MSEYVEFYSKNKFEKLVHLIGFIIRIYHDPRSCECQICFCDVTVQISVNRYNDVQCGHYFIQ